MATIELMAEVTGSVWKVLKSPGQTFTAEEPIVLIEAMKMEIPVAAEQAGKVVSIALAEGDAVTEGDVVVVVEV